jgi:amino acid adenylation domain-containing protein
LITFDREEIEGTVGARLQRVAGILPDYPAVQSANSAVSYAELDRSSDKLARMILDRRGPAPEPVGLLLDQGVECIAAVLGIMKAGKSVVILAPEFPVARLRVIWEDAGRPLIVTRSQFQGTAVELCQSPEGRMDLSDPADPTSASAPASCGPGSAAALLYTSGTTGEPKGVIMSHRIMLHTVWHNHTRYRIADSDRVVLISSHGFGAFIPLALSVVLSGATLHLLADRFLQLNGLIDYLRQEAVTILILPSYALLRQQADSMTERVSLPDLRHVLIGGEELRRPDLQRFRDFFPRHTEFSYRIASSETMMIAELCIAPESAVPWEKIPIGRIVPDKELLLLDESGGPVAPGAIGEIALRSRYLADGYWNKPDLTAAKFLPDPDGGDRRICLTGDMGRLLPDGLLEHAGRKDNIVRVRGFSIQLEAVVRALQELPGVQEAAAAAVAFRGGGNRLVAYIVPSGAENPSLQSLRNGLAAILPPQMIPTVFIFLPALPRTPSNRVDRSALPIPGTERPNLDVPLAEPRDDLERRLCRLWAEILGLDQIGLDDDFFLLGGDSLLAMHMVLRVEESIKRQIPTAFYARPTVRNLAELWMVEKSPQAESRPVISPSREDVPSSSAGDVRKRPWKKRKFRKRYKSLTAIVGPRSIPLAKGIPRAMAELASLFLSYPQGCRWLSHWCASPFVIRTFYPSETALFHRWLESLGGCPQAPANALNTCVMGNILWSTRFKRTVHFLEDGTFVESMRRSSARFHRDLGRIIAEAPFEQLACYFHIEGLEHVLAALRRECGVILVSYHGAANRFATAALPRWWNEAAIPTLSLTHGMRITRRKTTGPRSSINESAVMANVAVEGLRILKEGGVIQIVPDIGYDAADGVPLVIARHRFLVKSGFAEIALASGAAIIPTYSTRRISGRIDTRCLPPLDPGSPSSDSSARINGLLSQYGAFVEKAWSLAPESLLWQVIDMHMNRPSAENGA